MRREHQSRTRPQPLKYHEDHRTIDGLTRFFSLTQVYGPPRSHQRRGWASCCIIRERQGYDGRPVMGRQGTPKISATMYQRDGTWDGPSNPIPNGGIAWRYRANQSAPRLSPQTSHGDRVLEQGCQGAPALTCPICLGLKDRIGPAASSFPAQRDGGGHESFRLVD